MDENNKPSFKLPGFRFHPTEEELLEFYLKNMVNGKKMLLDIIGFLNIYRYDPWDLPELSKKGEREWYFFVPRDRKHSNGGRPNRTTEHGFWKATGSDRKVFTLSDPKRVIGLRKTLVFYQGRAPRGSKTDWVMNEYRLPDNHPLPMEIVLCKIYRKATSLKELEQRAAKEEEKSTITSYPTSPLSSSNGSFPFLSEDLVQQQPIHCEIMTHLKNEEEVEHKLDQLTSENNFNLKNEEEVEHKVDQLTSENNFNLESNTIKLPLGKESLGQLQVSKSNIEWAQDSNLPQSCSPWLENLLNFSSPTLMAHITSFLST